MLFATFLRDATNGSFPHLRYLTIASRESYSWIIIIYRAPAKSPAHYGLST